MTALVVRRLRLASGLVLFAYLLPPRASGGGPG
jgi:hypothetical protein